ncbi:uncharacterized protein LOC114535035 [Dendronephthya gigantea]|uniref:uncharacterized protein LOC114535035 n=1 Tax=Dendronephthya gigantea TaxID=151771 RepID=UPI001068EFCA|nr:uncharacterized protein LOC114535035 [Dendronephthya gigantea]
MADPVDEIGKAVHGVAREAFHATISGGTYNITIDADRAVVRDILFAASAVTISLGAIYAGYKLIARKMDGAVDKGLGGERDDQDVRDIKPKCLHVILHCFTDKRFLEVLEDFKSGGMKERLRREFFNIGIETEGLTVEIENIEEVEERAADIKKSNIGKDDGSHGQQDNASDLNLEKSECSSDSLREYDEKMPKAAVFNPE